MWTCVVKINRILTNVCSDDIEQSAKFYLQLFNFVVKYSSDWFVHLASSDSKLELGILRQQNPSSQQNAYDRQDTIYMTLVVDDVDAVHVNAQQLGYTVAQAPQMSTYGQKRMLVKDPAGVLVDVSSPSAI